MNLLFKAGTVSLWILWGFASVILFAYYIVRQEGFFSVRSTSHILISNLHCFLLTCAWFSPYNVQIQQFLLYNEVSLILVTFFLYYKYSLRYSEFVRLNFGLSSGVVRCVEIGVIIMNFTIYGLFQVKSMPKTFQINFYLGYFSLTTSLLSAFCFAPFVFRRLVWRDDHLNLGKEIAGLFFCWLLLMPLILTCIFLQSNSLLPMLFGLMNLIPTLWLVANPLLKYSLFMYGRNRTSLYTTRQIQVVPSGTSHSIDISIRSVPKCFTHPGASLEQMFRQPHEKERLWKIAKARFCEELILYLDHAYEYKNSQYQITEEQHVAFSNIVNKFLTEGSNFEITVPYSLKNEVLKYYQFEMFASIDKEAQNTILLEITDHIETAVKNTFILDYTKFS